VSTTGTLALQDTTARQDFVARRHAVRWRRN
jgi:hypothetical protein